MKARTILASVIITMAFFMSCGKLDPSTYHEDVYRIATVTCKDGKAGLLLDCYNEQPALQNFKDSSDLKKFGVSKGDRVIATISYDAVGIYENATLTLTDLWKINPVMLEEKKPADTLNYLFGFSQYTVANIMYPYIWSAGHFVNVAPGFSVPSKDSKSEFYVYPTGVSKDTLILHISSYIPEAALGMNTQDLLSCDISSMRKPVSDPREQNRRDSLLQILDSLYQDSIMVKVTIPDTMRFAYADTVILSKVKNDLPNSVSIPFDF